MALGLSCLTDKGKYFLALILVYSVMNFSHFYKWRYLQLDKVNILLTKNGLTKYLDNSQYGAHRNVAKEIFLDNPIFGVGIKNFRVESRNEKYNNLDHKFFFLYYLNDFFHFHFLLHLMWLIVLSLRC